jgi:predicted HAD superfamily Cof-like phosphohydrolase
MQGQVAEFHDRFGIRSRALPEIPTDPEVTARLRRLFEEYTELREAIEDGDIVGVANEAADLLYVVLGTCLIYGIDVQPVFEAVHAANMTKTEAEGGRIVKGLDFQRADVAHVLAIQNRLSN